MRDAHSSSAVVVESYAPCFRSGRNALCVVRNAHRCCAVVVVTQLTFVHKATDVMYAAWQRLKMGTRDAQLWRAIKKAYNWLTRVRNAVVIRFYKRHVIELEKQLCRQGQHEIFQNIKSARWRK